MIDLTEWLATGAWRTRPADPERLHEHVLSFARGLLDERRRRLKRRGKGLAGLDDAHRHKARIAAKKLRYAAEFFGSLYIGRKARRRHGRFLEAIEALQDLLGELNDIVIGPEVLAKFGIDATLPHSGEHRRKRLLKKAEEAYDALISARRFWGV
jgi:triphosphatase